MIPTVMGLAGGGGAFFIPASPSYFTGARTSIVPMKLCPFVKGGAAALVALGARL